MSAATASTTTRPPVAHVASVVRPGWLSDLYEHYEDGADEAVCLHLPHDECDHRVFRCLVCCGHATTG